MRQIIGKVIIIVLCVGLVTGFIYVDSHSKTMVSASEISFSLGDEIITAWNDGEMYYLFLPSYAEVSDVILTSYSMEFEVVEEGLLMMNGTSLEELALDKVFTCRNLTDSEKFSLCIMKSENLPTLFMLPDFLFPVK